MLSNVQLPAPTAAKAGPAPGPRTSARKADQKGDASAAFGDVLADTGGPEPRPTGAAEKEAAGSTRAKAGRPATDEADDTALSEQKKVALANAEQIPAMPPPMSMHQITLIPPAADPAKPAESADDRSENSPPPKGATLGMNATLPSIRPINPPNAQETAPTGDTRRTAEPVKTLPTNVDPVGPPPESHDELPAPDLLTAKLAAEPSQAAPSGTPTHLPPIVERLFPARGPGQAVHTNPTHLPPIVEADPAAVREAAVPIPPHLPPSVDPAPPVDPAAIREAAAPIPGAAGPVKPRTDIAPHGPPVQPPDDLPAGPAAPAITDRHAAMVGVLLPTDGSADPYAAAARTTAKPPAAGTVERLFPDPNPPIIEPGGNLLPVNDPTVRTATAPANPPPAYFANASVEITSATRVAGSVAAMAAADGSASVTIKEDPAARTATILPGSPANVADRRTATGRAASGAAADVNTQASLAEQLRTVQNRAGTPAAKEQASVTAETTTAVTIDRSDLLRRGAAGSPERADNTHAPLPVFTNHAAMPDLPTVAAMPTAAASPVPTFERLDAMLQTVLDAGIKAGANGRDDMELRVRLNGGTDDVTVRLQMHESRMHVTFQTNSPELRQALEHGWSDFTAKAAQTSPVMVEPPRFVTPPNGNAAHTPDFSSGQQTPQRQDAPRAADEALPMAGSSGRGSRLVSATLTNPTAVTNDRASSRWTGWA